MLLSSGSPGTICEKTRIRSESISQLNGSLQKLLCWNPHNKEFVARGLRTGSTGSNLRCKILT